MCGWQDDTKLAMTKYCIQDTADLWLQGIEAANKDTYAKVKAIITAAFKDKREDWQKHRDMISMKQEKGETVMEFAAKLKKYQAEGQNEGALLSVFVHGLTPSIAREVAKAPAATLTTAIDLAARLETLEKRAEPRGVTLHTATVEDMRSGKEMNQGSSEAMGGISEDAMISLQQRIDSVLSLMAVDATQTPIPERNNGGSSSQPYQGSTSYQGPNSYQGPGNYQKPTRKLQWTIPGELRKSGLRKLQGKWPRGLPREFRGTAIQTQFQ